MDLVGTEGVFGLHNRRYIYILYNYCKKHFT